jgi:hypothetical protein
VVSEGSAHGSLSMLLSRISWQQEHIGGEGLHGGQEAEKEEWAGHQV